MRNSHCFRLSVTFAAAMLAGGVGALAETPRIIKAFEMPPSFSGSYLAGRAADQARDVGAAVTFYRNAIKADADPSLMERLLLLSLAAGDIEPSFDLATRLVKFDTSNPAGRLALGVQALKAGDSEAATAQVKQMGAAELSRLTSGLTQGWILFAAGKVDDAVTNIRAITGPTWFAVFKEFHVALILDAAGRTAEAAEAISHAYKTETPSLRLVVAYARIMARGGKRDEAIRAITSIGGTDPRHPQLRTLLADIQAGASVKPLVATVSAGVAETLYGLGSLIGTDDGPEIAAAYLRLSSYLDVDGYLSTVALGDVFQAVERFEDAIAVYETVPKTAEVRRNADIQIGLCLAALKKPDEAITSLRRVLDADPQDVEAAISLGNVYRNDSRFAEAATAYTQAIDTLGDPAKTDWRIFYYRGMALERAKRWPEAEVDFKQALLISPEQPSVLNYLGYSWAEQGLHLDEALSMIKRAVTLSPNDGYIVDSLGWAYHKLGRTQEAVKELETAVELSGGDVTINDHLGDAYWAAGRKREARFQWEHARGLNPDDKEQLAKIINKIEHGLDDQRSEGSTGANSIQVAKGESLWVIAGRVYGDPGQYSRILDANKDRIGDPNVIFPGMTLDIPSDKVN